MSKIEKILRQKLTNEEYEELGSLEDLISRVAVEYAEWYANKCLELVDKMPQEIPIMSFQLPDHE